MWSNPLRHREFLLLIFSAGAEVWLWLCLNREAKNRPFPSIWICILFFELAAGLGPLIWSFFFLVLSCPFCFAQQQRPGVNWGTQSTHRLRGDIVVKMLKDNGITKVKLFDADSSAMNALQGSNMQVMVGIPNDMLTSLASSSDAADKWVKKNVSKYIDDVDIKYVAVGNEPFLKAYNKSFESVTVPALQNIQSALSRAGLSKIKITVPLNADVLQSTNDMPSTGIFRADIKSLMLSIVKILDSSNSAFTINLYPFISLYQDSNFPKSFAYFDGSTNVIQDGSNTYTNVFDANYDLLVAALKDAGYPNMPIIVGEVGWPTDGDSEATVTNAHKFNQGLVKHVMANTGTPLRPGSALDVYLFSLIDEDEKSIAPGNFERHWGIYTYDGQAKYKLDLSGKGQEVLLTNAKGVSYLPSQWCVVKNSNSVNATLLASNVDYACTYADCTSIQPGGSCSFLTDTQKDSYAFNSYYQQTDQKPTSCNLQGLGVVTTTDPSISGCRFELQMATDSSSSSGAIRLSRCLISVVQLILVGLIYLIS